MSNYPYYICSVCDKTIVVSKSYYKVLRDRNPHRICRPCQKRHKKEEYLKQWKVSSKGRICVTCNTWKPWKEYSKAKSDRGKEQRIHCLDCLYKKSKTKWYENEEFRNRQKEASKRSHLRRKYGITLEELNTMIDKQNNKCAICTTEMNPPCVDHCHKTGKVRDLLCRKCNIGIGKFKESLDLMKAAINYIRKHNEI